MFILQFVMVLPDDTYKNIPKLSVLSKLVMFTLVMLQLFTSNNSRPCLLMCPGFLLLILMSFTVDESASSSNVIVPVLITQF